MSSFRFNEKGKKLKVLNLVVSEPLINGMTELTRVNSKCNELHKLMIKIFPLAMATMYTIQTSDQERKNKYGEKIKYEYLLSQVLMNVLHKAGIDGVAYLSRQGKNDFQYPQMVCLAIPIKDASEYDEYGGVINDFVMTDPVLYNGFLNENEYEKKSYINEKYPKYTKITDLNHEGESFNAKIDYSGKTVCYQDTLFSKFDDYLINQKHDKFPYNK